MTFVFHGWWLGSSRCGWTAAYPASTGPIDPMEGQRGQKRGRQATLTCLSRQPPTPLPSSFPNPSRPTLLQPSRLMTYRFPESLVAGLT